jgi:hypothetical protein
MAKQTPTSGRAAKELQRATGNPPLVDASKLLQRLGFPVTKVQAARPTRMGMHAVMAALTEVQAAEAALTAAEETMATYGPTPEQLRVEAAEAEKQASENGDPVKSMAVKITMLRRWCKWLGKHGDEYGYDEAAG